MPTDEVLAAIDAVFQDWPVRPIRPTTTAPAPSSSGKVVGRPLLKDYVRELQQEFQDQQDLGKR
jgi:hypothetical protein